MKCIFIHLYIYVYILYIICIYIFISHSIYNKIYRALPGLQCQAPSRFLILALQKVSLHFIHPLIYSPFDHHIK